MKKVEHVDLIEVKTLFNRKYFRYVKNIVRVSSNFSVVEQTQCV